jgi:hypothetical protein
MCIPSIFSIVVSHFLVKARGYSENGLLLSSLPLVVAGCANLGGGLATNALVKKLGLK